MKWFCSLYHILELVIEFLRQTILFGIRQIERIYTLMQISIHEFNPWFNQFNELALGVSYYLTWKLHPPLQKGDRVNSLSTSEEFFKCGSPYLCRHFTYLYYQFRHQFILLCNIGLLDLSKKLVPAILKDFNFGFSYMISQQKPLLYVNQDFVGLPNFEAHGDFGTDHPLEILLGFP